MSNSRVTRRQLLQGAAVTGVAALLRPAVVWADGDNDERLGPFGPWSDPVNLGPVVNSPFDDNHPAISKHGLSLYITSNRPGGVNGINTGNFAEIWVSHRASLDDPWETPVNLDAFNPVPVLNSRGFNTGIPNFSPDGHLMFFSSVRPGGCGGADLWVSRRKHTHDDFGWQEPVNLECTINSAFDENAPTYFEDEGTGIITLYFTSTRPAGVVGTGGFDIYVSALGPDGSFGHAVLVAELSSPSNETRTAIRRDGLEMFLASNRPGGVGASGIGANDIWVSTRETAADSWSTPVNLGRPVNSEFEDGAPALAWDGTTMYFYSRRGGSGGRDLYVTTRTKSEQG